MLESCIQTIAKRRWQLSPKIMANCWISLVEDITVITIKIANCKATAHSISTCSAPTSVGRFCTVMVLNLHGQSVHVVWRLMVAWRTNLLTSPRSAGCDVTDVEIVNTCWELPLDFSDVMGHRWSWSLLKKWTPAVRFLSCWILHQLFPWQNLLWDTVRTWTLQSH